MIELRNVTKEYSKGNSALNGVSVKIERGEFVFIVGDSGSGKSTLIRLIMKELNPTEGTIIVNGQNLNRMKHRNIAKYRRGLGVVFQDFRLLRDLDPTNSWEIMSLLKEANERGTTVLVVTHNQEIVNEMNERVITMKQGVIVSDEQKGGYIDED